eukprot:178994_1
MGEPQDLLDFYIDACDSRGLKPDSVLVRLLENKFPDDLEAFNLSNTFLGSDNLAAAFSLLQFCRQLRTVNLENCHLKRSDVEVLISVLPSCPSITTLHLSQNPALGASAGQLLVNMARENKQIKAIALTGTIDAFPGIKNDLKKILDENAKVPEVPLPLMLTKPKQTTNVNVYIDDAQKAPEVTAAHAEKAAEDPGTSEAVKKALKTRGQVRASMLKGGTPSVAGSSMSTAGGRGKKNAESLVLKADLLDHENRTMAQHNKNYDKLPTKMERFAEMHLRGTRLLEELEVGTQWGIEPTYTQDKLVDDGKMDIKVPELMQLLQEYSPDTSSDAARVPEMLGDLLRKETPPQRVRALERELADIGAHHGPGSSEMVNFALSLVDLVRSEPISMEAIIAHLAESDPKLSQTIDAHRNANAERVQAREEGDIARCEALHDKTINLQRTALDIITERINYLLGHNNFKEMMLQKLNDLQDAAHDKLNKASHQNNNLVDRIMADLARLAQLMVAKSTEMDDKKAVFDGEMDKAYLEIEDNRKRQAQLWTRIQAQYNNLKNMGEERLNKIKDTITRKEDYEREVVEYEKFRDVAAQHDIMLSDLLRSAKSCDNFLSAFDGFINEAEAIISRSNDDKEQQIAELLLEEQKRHQDVYRDHYLCVGELIYKKEKRLEEVERTLRHLQFQVDVAKETLDPNVDLYRDQQSDLVR